MKPKSLILAAGLLTAVGFAAPRPANAQDDLVKKLAGIEKTLWKAWKDGDAAPFEKHFAADVVQIGPWGMSGDRAGIIAGSSAGTCEVRGYEMENWSLHRVTTDVVILAFQAEQDVTCDGEVLADESYFSTVFVREGDAWKVAAHQETPASSDEG